MTAPRERALELLERHITSGREDSSDPAVTARECLLALEGLGYRPPEARPDWRIRRAGSEPSEETRSALETARERCAVSPTRVHPAEPPKGEVTCATEILSEENNE